MKFRVPGTVISGLFLFLSLPVISQVSSHTQDIIPLTMSRDASGSSNTKLNVNGKNMYKWYDYPASYEHVLSREEDNKLNSRTEESKGRELLINAVVRAHSSAFCTSFDKLKECMKNDFKDVKGKFVNHLIYKVSECEEVLPGAAKATLLESDDKVKCEQVFLKSQNYKEALAAFEKVKKELAPCRPEDWFVTEDFPGVNRGDKDKYFGFYNTRYNSDPERMDIGLELVLNFDTYFVRMIFKKKG